MGRIWSICPRFKRSKEWRVSIFKIRKHITYIVSNHNSSIWQKKKRVPCYSGILLWRRQVKVRTKISNHTCLLPLEYYDFLWKPALVDKRYSMTEAISNNIGFDNHVFKRYCKFTILVNCQGMFEFPINFSIKHTCWVSAGRVLLVFFVKILSLCIVSTILCSS